MVFAPAQKLSSINSNVDIKAKLTPSAGHLKHYLKATFTLESIFRIRWQYGNFRYQIRYTEIHDERGALVTWYLALFGLSGFLPLNRVFTYGGPEGSHMQIKNSTRKLKIVHAN